MVATTTSEGGRSDLAMQSRRSSSDLPKPSARRARRVRLTGAYVVVGLGAVRTEFSRVEKIHATFQAGAKCRCGVLVFSLRQWPIQGARTKRGHRQGAHLRAARDKSHAYTSATVRGLASRDWSLAGERAGEHGRTDNGRHGAPGLRAQSETFVRCRLAGVPSAPSCSGPWPGHSPMGTVSPNSCGELAMPCSVKVHLVDSVEGSALQRTSSLPDRFQPGEPSATRRCPFWRPASASLGSR